MNRSKRILRVSQQFCLTLLNAVNCLAYLSNEPQCKLLLIKFRSRLTHSLMKITHLAERDPLIWFDWTPDMHQSITSHTHYSNPMVAA